MSSEPERLMWQLHRFVESAAGLQQELVEVKQGLLLVQQQQRELLERLDALQRLSVNIVNLAQGVSLKDGATNVGGDVVGGNKHIGRDEIRT